MFVHMLSRRQVAIMRNPDGTERGFVIVNRNLMNFPLARDARAKLHWHRSPDGWYCDLPGQDRLQLQFPDSSTKQARRAPTAFDTEALFRLFSEAKKRDSSELEFASFSALLKSFGYGVDARSRRKVKRALTLWSDLSLWFGQWYAPPRYRYLDKTGGVYAHWRKGREKQHVADETNGSMQLPPAIRVLEFGPGYRVRIMISRKWLGQWAAYYKRVPLPLPTDATTQNLLLNVLTLPPVRGLADWRRSQRVRRDKDDPEMDDPERVCAPRRILALCRNCGLTHHNRSIKLSRSIEMVQAYFKRHGGHLTWTTDYPKERSIYFIIDRDVAVMGRDTTWGSGQKVGTQPRSKQGHNVGANRDTTWDTVPPYDIPYERSNEKRSFY